MAKNFSEDDLNKMGLQQNPDGSYSKPKTVLQPREITGITINGNTGKVISVETQPLQPFRIVKLTLFGEPMAKQSVRFGPNGHAFQPKKKTDRKKDYQEQIRKQLPPDFVPFQTTAFITKLHFMYPPRKAFQKEKGKMEAIRTGKKFYKNSRPDMDNLQKLLMDSLSDLVFADDSIIVGIDDMKKYYGIGGCVIIEMKGY